MSPDQCLLYEEHPTFDLRRRLLRLDRTGVLFFCGTSDPTVVFSSLGALEKLLSITWRKKNLCFFGHKIWPPPKLRPQNQHLLTWNGL